MSTTAPTCKKCGSPRLAPAMERECCSPPSSWDEARTDVIGQNGNDGDHYTVVSDGSTASYYELPEGARELQDLISHRDMNAQIGEIFRTCYRYGRAAHSDRKREAKKILFYALAEVRRLEGEQG